MVIKAKETCTLALKSVAAVIYCENQFLLQLRDNKKSINSPNHWGLFGGKIEKKETAKKALFRELAEELEFRPKKVSFLGEISYRRHINSRLMRNKKFYSIPIIPSEIKKMRLHEGQKFELHRIENIVKTERLVYWDYFGVFLQYRKFLES